MDKSKLTSKLKSIATIIDEKDGYLVIPDLPVCREVFSEIPLVYSTVRGQLHVEGASARLLQIMLRDLVYNTFDVEVIKDLLQREIPINSIYPAFQGEGGFVGTPSWFIRVQGCSVGCVQCVTGDTLVPTSRGLLPIEKIGKALDSALVVGNDEGFSVITKFLNMGEKPTIKVTTELGYSLTGSMDHKVRVIKDGKYVWKELQTLRVGDYVAIQGNFLFDLPPVNLEKFFPVRDERTKSSVCTLPTHFNDELAVLLGYWYGEGVRIRPNRRSYSMEMHFYGDDAEDLYQYFDQISNRIFQIRGHVYKGNSNGNGNGNGNSIKYVLCDRDVFKFLYRLSGIFRSPERRVPGVVLRSSWHVIASFLKGLFEADGSVSDSGSCVVSFGSSSRSLSEVVHVALLGLGIFSGLSEGLSHPEARPMYYVNITHIDDLVRFSELVGFISRRKQEMLRNVIYARINSPINEEVEAPYRKKNQYYLKVTSIMESGVREVFDLSVTDKNLTFIGNGFVNFDCDTKYTWKFDDSKRLSADRILSTVVTRPSYQVCITGGDPMEYVEGCKSLIILLRAFGFEVLFQAAGTKYDEQIFGISSYVDFDIKTPNTGVSSDLSLIQYLRPSRDYVKAVIQDDTDFDYVVDVVEKVVQGRLLVYLQPSTGVRWDLEKYLESLRRLEKKVAELNQCNIRVVPQIHKILYGYAKDK